MSVFGVYLNVFLFVWEGQIVSLYQKDNFRNAKDMASGNL